MTKSFLDDVYGARDADGTRRLYDDWAATYDSEVAENGYVTPGRCAEALARFSQDPAAPVLDFGCGTGLSGHALRDAGFTTVDGLDLSRDMLAEARAKGIYRALTRIEAGDALAHDPGDYAAISAIGVIGAGAAPITVFDQILYGLGKGGLFVFSFNDHALADPQNEGRVHEWTDCGAARLLLRERGPHLPGKGLESQVYVIEKR